MDKRLFGLIASTAVVFAGSGALADNATLNAKYSSLAEWAIGEGYRWMQVDGKIVFCRPEITTGTHIKQEGCLTHSQLVAHWQAWKTGPNYYDPNQFGNAAFH
jgi:hypothetical protein